MVRDSFPPPSNIPRPFVSKAYIQHYRPPPKNIMASQVCPVVGTTTSVLPPNHPSYDVNDSEARCPVTNAKVEHHHVIHNHPGGNAISHESTTSMDATACPALKNANRKESVTDAT